MQKVLLALRIMRGKWRNRRIKNVTQESRKAVSTGNSRGFWRKINELRKGKEVRKFDLKGRWEDQKHGAPIYYEIWEATYGKIPMKMHVTRQICNK